MRKIAHVQAFDITVAVNAHLARNGNLHRFGVILYVFLVVVVNILKRWCTSGGCRSFETFSAASTRRDRWHVDRERRCPDRRHRIIVFEFRI